MMRCVAERKMIRGGQGRGTDVGQHDPDLTSGVCRRISPCFEGLISNVVKVSVHRKKRHRGLPQHHPAQSLVQSPFKVASQNRSRRIQGM